MQQIALDDDLGHGFGDSPDSAGTHNAAPNADDSKGQAKLPPDVKMTRLAESFRCLEYKPGVRPWNAIELADWVRSGKAMDAQAQTSAFVLEVANMSAVWDGVPSFNMYDAACCD